MKTFSPKKRKVMNRSYGRVVQRVCGFGFVAILFVNANAQTNSECEQVVIDKASSFTPEQVHRLEQAADQLRLKGAEIHVLTLSIPSNSNAKATGNIEPAVNDVLLSCSNWRSDRAELKENLILLAAVPKAHVTEVRFGSRWSPVLSGLFQSVMSDDMNPIFRLGDVTGGFIAGEQRITKEIARVSIPQGGPGPAELVLSDLSQRLCQAIEWTFLVFIVVGVLLSSLKVLFGGLSGTASSKKATVPSAENLDVEQKWAAECIASIRKRFAEHEAISGSRVPETKSIIDEATERYAKIVASFGAISAPSIAQAHQATKEFKAISDLAGKAQSILDGVNVSIGSEWKPEYTQETNRHLAKSVSSMTVCRKCGKGYGIGEHPFCPHGYAATSSAPESQGLEGKVRIAAASSASSSSDGFVTGLVVGGLLSNHSGSTGTASQSGSNSDNESSNWSSSSSSDSGGSSDWSSSGSDGGSSSW